MAKRRNRGDGSLHLRKDGRWEGRYVVGYDDKGLPITKNVLAKTKLECTAKLAQLRGHHAAQSGRDDGYLGGTAAVHLRELDPCLRRDLRHDLFKVQNSDQFLTALRDTAGLDNRRAIG